MEAPTEKVQRAGAAAAVWPVGQRLGHYQILSRLGAGGMGEVYLARDTRLERQVAVKLLPAKLSADGDAARRFLREARTAAALDHPNICAIHEIGEDCGRSFIVMAYVEGETLAARLERERPSWASSVALAQQVAEALADAHAHQIVHRDIKPANIIVTPRGQAKVLDFGLAKSLPGPQVSSEIATATLLSTPGMVVGTAPYMSPEQVRGERVDARTDVWSFGVVLYEMLAARRPFEGKSSIEILSAILSTEPVPLPGAGGAAPQLERLVRKCLEKDPARRYQTMQELLTDLQAASLGVEAAASEPASGESPATRTKTAGASIARPHGLRYSPYSLALAILLTLGAAAAAYTVFVLRRAPALIADRQAVSSPAYDDYLRGKVLISEESRDSNEAAIEHLESAVAADPGLAPAFAALALAYYNKAFYYAPPEASKELDVDAEVAVEKALALDPNLADAHHARGVILWSHANRFPHQQAIQSLQRALTLNPSLDDAHHRLGMIYMHIGLLDSAWSEIEKALAINPANTLARFRFGVIDLYRGRYEDALAVLQGIPSDANPSLVQRNLAMAYLRMGRTEEAAAVIDEYLRSHSADEGGAVTSTRAILLAMTGRAREAEAAIQRAIEIGRGYGHFHHSAHNVASAYALLGRADQAIEWLEVAAADGFPCYPCFESDAFLEGLRQDARYRDFMTRLSEQRERYQTMS